MPNPDHLAILSRGVEEWNRWRADNAPAPGDIEGIDLRGADLRGASLAAADFRSVHLQRANLRGADLAGAILTHARLNLASLRGANLSGADLRHAALRRTALHDAKMQGVQLHRARFRQGSLDGADLTGATLWSSTLEHTSLDGACFRDVHWGDCCLEGLDLSTADLAGGVVGSPCTVGVRTLKKTAFGIASSSPALQEVETFLRGCGLPDDMLDLFRSWVDNPEHMASVFISHAHDDKPFARRLYEALQAHGVRCWLDEKELKIGSDIEAEVVNAIGRHDKLILCCSEKSLSSTWVAHEIDRAFRREKETGQLVLLPLDLDGFVFNGDWTVRQRTTCEQIGERLVGDFRDWEGHDSFDRAFRRLVEALEPTPATSSASR